MEGITIVSKSTEAKLGVTWELAMGSTCSLERIDYSKV
jgi:hypothetical protein